MYENPFWLFIDSVKIETNGGGIHCVSTALLLIINKVQISTMTADTQSKNIGCIHVIEITRKDERE